MNFQSEFNLNELELLELDDNEDSSNKNEILIKSLKNDYKNRKLDNKLKKYEIIIKNVEKINRVDESQVSFYNRNF